MVEFKTPVEGALYMHNRFGAKVFCQWGGKHGFKGWQNEAASSTEQSIIQKAKQYPGNDWGVYCGASGIMVIDCDNKNGKNGSERLRELEAEHGRLPETFTVKTPSGGFHYYFRGECKSSTDVLAEGLDTKSRGGLTVCPGSRGYEVVDWSDIADAPKWAVEAANAKHTPSKTEYSGLITDGELIIEEGRRDSELVRILGHLRSMGLGYEALKQTALAVNAYHMNIPLDEDQAVRKAESVSSYPVDSAKAVAEFQDIQDYNFKKASEITVNSIKPRKWVLGSRYAEGHISVLIAPGGVGKSTLTINEAVSVATNREDISGEDVHEHGGVWIHSTEDSSDEIKRKIAALCLHYDIDFRKLDNLIYTSCDDSDLVIATEHKGGEVLPQYANIGLIKKTIKEQKIKLFIIDPFVRSHRVSENDNAKMDQVVTLLSDIAKETKCAIGVVHHSSKLSNSNSKYRGNMDMARGASSLVSAARIANTLDVMNDEEAKKYNIIEKWRYVRIDNAKANLSMPCEKAVWYEKISVDFPHLIEYTGSQSVGILKPVKFEEIRASEVSEKRDIMQFFIKHIGVGNTKKLSDIADILLQGDDEFSHLFSGIRRKQTVTGRIALMFEEPFSYNGSICEVYHDKENKNIKTVKISDEMYN